MSTWDENIPIYRQIKARVVAEILEGDLAEGAMLPSVRQVASDSQVNPLTVARAYQELADEGLVEKIRGIGMMIAAGATARLLEQERTRFLSQEWPLIRDRIRRLGLAPATLFPLAGDAP